MKRNVLALGAATVIAGLPIVAAIATSPSDAAPGSPRRSVSDTADSSGDPAGTVDTTMPTPTVVPPPPPVPIPTAGDDDAGHHEDDLEDHDDDHHDDD